MGPIGVQEMMLVFLVALVLFGPKKLPELGRLLGKGLTEYRRAKSELKSTFETHLRELEREANVDSALKSVTSPPPATSSYSSTTYDEYGHEPNYSDPSPYSGAASDQPDSSTSSTASETATQDAEANRDTSSSSPTVTPVAGTVPRVNGVHSSVVEPESPALQTTEGHSA
jgi:sec-independent protein translocase protein TatA